MANVITGKAHREKHTKAAAAADGVVGTPSVAQLDDRSIRDNSVCADRC